MCDDDDDRCVPACALPPLPPSAPPRELVIDTPLVAWYDVWFYTPRVVARRWGYQEDHRWVEPRENARLGSPFECMRLLKCGANVSRLRQVIEWFQVIIAKSAGWVRDCGIHQSGRVLVRTELIIAKNYVNARANERLLQDACSVSVILYCAKQHNPVDVMISVLK